jgi:hypothetical protein
MQENLKNLNLYERIRNKEQAEEAESPKTPERKFDFKIKVIQTELSENGDFYQYLNDLNNSSVPFMARYSGYIEKLNFMNSLEGGLLSENYTAQSAESGGENPEVSKGFTENHVFMSVIANQDVLDEVQRKKEKMMRNMLSKKNAPELVLNDLLEQFFESREAWEFEEVDIPANLYMFDMVNGVNPNSAFADYTESGADENAEFEEFDGYDDYGEYGEPEEFETVEMPDLNSKFEVKFNAKGSIKLLNGNMIEVKYDESDMTGEKNSFIRFLFNPENKEAVTIHRYGAPDTWLNCEKGVRISESGTFRGSIVTVNTKELTNNMSLDGGNLYLSYVRETNGASSEMVTHIISAVPSKE